MSEDTNGKALNIIAFLRKGLIIETDGGTFEILDVTKEDDGSILLHFSNWKLRINQETREQRLARLFETIKNHSENLPELDLDDIATECDKGMKQAADVFGDMLHGLSAKITQGANALKEKAGQGKKE